jgi:hypothetical protein
MSQLLNLFNPLFLKQKKYFSANTMVQALALIAGGMAVFYGVLAFQVSSLQKQRDATAAQLGEVQAQLVRFGGAGGKGGSPTLADEVARLESQVRAREEVLNSIEDTSALGNTRGYSPYLTALARRTVSGLWVTGLSVSGAGEEFSIQGRVLRPEILPGYIRQLNREEVLRGKSISELRMTAREERPEVAAKDAGAPRRYVEFALAARPADSPAGGAR